MEILYLPSNPKYRAFVERALEFVEQVYKDELLADLKIVAFSAVDRKDLEEILKLEKILNRRISWFSQYVPEDRMVIIGEPYDGVALYTFWSVVEEVTHHVFWLRRQHNMERVITALHNDIPRLRMVVRRAKQDEAVKVSILFEEICVKYIVDNYFYKHNVEPLFKPWARGNLREFLLDAFYEPYVRAKLEGTILVEIALLIRREVVRRRNPLSNLRNTAHAIFTEAIKRFPVEVYNSNPSRYKILYMKEFIQKLPL